MALVRQRAEWERASAIMTLIHNVNCTKRSDVIQDVNRFNPYAEKRETRRRGVTIKELGEYLANGHTIVTRG